MNFPRCWLQRAALAAAAATAFLGALPGTAAAAPGIRTYLDGRELSFDVPPVVENGRTLVPARAILEALGAEVEWDGDARTVTARYARSEIRLAIDQADARLNGWPMRLDAPARIVAGRTLVPLRFVSEALGAQVNWSPEQQAIAIDSRGNVARGAAARPPQPSPALRLVAAARGLVGRPYAWGGSTPAGFDCSGFTAYVAGQLGVELPRTSQEQFGVGVAVRRAELLPGDLVFFSTYAEGPSHVGVYAGDGTFVHAENEDTGVTVTPMDAAYWSARYVGARRIVR